MMADGTTDIVSLYGGPFDPVTLPASFSTTHFQNLETILTAFATGRWPEGLTEGSLDLSHRKYSFQIVFVNNPSMDVRLHPLTRDSYLAVIPIGLYARMYILACRLITYWKRQRPKKFETSFLDTHYEGTWRVPPLVAPIFEFYEDIGIFWDQVDKFQRASQIDDLMWYDAVRVINVALSFALFHEQAHLIWEHRNPIRDFLIDSSEGMAPVRRLVRKGFELQADIDAASLAVATFQGGIDAEGYADDDQKVSNDFLRIGYAYTLTFGAFDPWLRSFATYRRQDHPHPIVRHNAVLESTWFRLTTVSPRWAALWGRHAAFGFEKCIDALNWLSSDCLESLPRPGPDDEWRPLIPVHSLCYPSQIKQNGAIRRHISCARLTKIAADALILKYEAGNLDRSDLEALLPISQLIDCEDIPLEADASVIKRYLSPIFGELVEQSLRPLRVEHGLESHFSEFRMRGAPAASEAK